MSETFEKILVKDDRLGCITPKVKYQVFKGGQNITCQTYKAISQTAANHVYSVQVSKSRDNHQQRGAMAVHNHPQDLTPR